MKNYKYVFIALAFIAFAGCKKVIFETEPKNNPEAIFENLWTTFKTDYAPFEERGVNWDNQYQIFRPQVNSSTSTEALKNIIKSMLRTLNDGHVSLTTPGENIFYSNIIIDQKIDDKLFDLSLIKSNYLQNTFKENGNGLNTYGWIGNVGYWHIGAIGENMLVLDKILEFFSTAKGLIVDMRHNKGGDFTYAFSEFGRFTDQKRLVFRSKTKNGKGPNDYTAWYDWSISPSGEYFNKPIVLLTDRYTISAGERTVMAFKSLPNVIHVGDTTNGAIATKIGKELTNGWFYSIVTQKTLFQNGVTYEGSGIPPNEYIKNTVIEMTNGHDKSLEKAISKF